MCPKKILLINIWIFIPLLVYRWGVEGVTATVNRLHKGDNRLHPLKFKFKLSENFAKLNFAFGNQLQLLVIDYHREIYYFKMCKNT